MSLLCHRDMTGQTENRENGQRSEAQNLLLLGVVLEIQFRIRFPTD